MQPTNHPYKLTRLRSIGTIHRSEKVLEKSIKLRWDVEVDMC